LRLVCALPFVRMVALAGRISRFNLAAGGDIDLFMIVQRGHIWSTAAVVRQLAALMSRRCMVRATAIVDDEHLALEPRDAAIASHVIHLKPLIGAGMLQELFAANRFVDELF